MSRAHSAAAPFSFKTMGFETVMRLLLLLRRDYGLRVPAGWAADYSFLTAGDAKLRPDTAVIHI